MPDTNSLVDFNIACWLADRGGWDQHGNVGIHFAHSCLGNVAKAIFSRGLIMSLQHPVDQSVVSTSEVTDAGERASILITQIREALQGLRNGQITISVHNGEVTMIDRILRKRHYRSRSTS